MATINCPHCGKEMFDGLDTCPHCGGPVMADALKEKIDINDVYQYAEAKEKKWFWGTTIVGIVGSIYCLVAYPDDLDIISALILFLFAFYVLFVTFIYGNHFFHSFRRFQCFGIVIGLLLTWIIGLFAGWIGGFFWYPRAIIRLIRRKPLLSEKEFQKWYTKNLI